jgi:hypothetical protein
VEVDPLTSTVSKNFQNLALSCFRKDISKAMKVIGKMTGPGS